MPPPQDATEQTSATAASARRSDLYARLQVEQERTGAPLAEIIRRALNEYLTPREQGQDPGVSGGWVVHAEIAMYLT